MTLALIHKRHVGIGIQRRGRLVRWGLWALAWGAGSGCGSPDVLRDPEVIVVCPTTQNLCDELCVDLKSDEENCGHCGVSCRDGETCRLGACQCEEERRCDGSSSDSGGDGDSMGGSGSNGNTSGDRDRIGGGDSRSDGDTGGDGDSGSGGAGGSGGNGQVVSSGGVESGGAASGGASSGGAASGGASSGGAASGGVSSGGESSGGAASGGASGGGSSSKDLLGYHVDKDWVGSVESYAVGQVAVSGDPVEPGTYGPYCVQGTVPASEGYENEAGVRFFVDQQDRVQAEAFYQYVSGDGLELDVSVNTLTPPNFAQEPYLRVILVGKDGADQQERSWCVNLAGTSTIGFTIPWTSFNSSCWDGRGDDFDPGLDAIKEVQVLIPDSGPLGNDVVFDFCVNHIGPDSVEGRGSGQIIAACPNNGTTWSGTHFDPYTKLGSGDYRFQSNFWNLVNGSSAVTMRAGGGFELSSQSCSTTTDAPCGSPSVYIGTNADGGARSANFVPRRLAAIDSIPTCLGWSADQVPDADNYRVQYDLWFNSDASATSGEKFLTVQLRKSPDFQPGGMFPVENAAVIGDQTWEVWDGLQHEGRNVISYAATHPRAEGAAYSFDLKDFIDDAMDRGVLSSTQYLITVIGGIEYFDGGEGASIDGFTAQVNPD